MGLSTEKYNSSYFSKIFSAESSLNQNIFKHNCTQIINKLCPSRNLVTRLHPLAGPDVIPHPSSAINEIILPISKPSSLDCRGDFHHLFSVHAESYCSCLHLSAQMVHVLFQYDPVYCLVSSKFHV